MSSQAIAFLAVAGMSIPLAAGAAGFSKDELTWLTADDVVIDD